MNPPEIRWEGLDNFEVIYFLVAELLKILEGGYPLGGFYILGCWYFLAISYEQLTFYFFVFLFCEDLMTILYFPQKCPLIFFCDLCFYATVRKYRLIMLYCYM